MGLPPALSLSISTLTGVVGAAWRRTAMAPVTCGAAMDVPLSDPKVSGAGGIDDVMLEPGAKRRLGKIAGEATFEKLDTPSLFVDEATGMAEEIQAGALMAAVKNELPAAMTVATPGSVGSVGCGVRS